MSDVAHTEVMKIGGRSFRIELMYDQDCPSPLEHDEDVKITCRKDAREQYGNEPLDHDAHEVISRRIEAFGNEKVIALASALTDDEEPLDGEPLIGLPVYVYQHGNVSMSTEPYSCRWDSGQSGFVYIEKKTVLDWMGGKRLTKAKVERALKSLASIVEEYGKWCNGECYGYQIIEVFDTGDEDEAHEKELDSCWGFIGFEYALAEAKSAVTALAKERKAA